MTVRRARRMTTGWSSRRDSAGEPSYGSARIEDVRAADDGNLWAQWNGLPVSSLAALTAASVSMHCGDALAKGGELGLLEGRSVALLHPASMFTLLAVTGYSGYLGWKWRRQRTIGADIDNLKVRSLAAMSDGCFFLIKTKASNGSPLLQALLARSFVCVFHSHASPCVAKQSVAHRQS